MKVILSLADISERLLPVLRREYPKQDITHLLFNVVGDGADAMVTAEIIMEKSKPNPYESMGDEK